MTRKPTGNRRGPLPHGWPQDIAAFYRAYKNGWSPKQEHHFVQRACEKLKNELRFLIAPGECSYVWIEASLVALADWIIKNERYPFR